MTGFTRAARSTDFGWMEALPAIVLIAALFFGGDWASEAADESDLGRSQRGQALAIAMVGTNDLMDVEFTRLEPTTGYVPMPAGLTSTTDASHDEGTYAVEVRITDLDVAGRLRRVEVRVGYEADSGERTWVETATVRQDWAASHADSQRPRSTRTTLAGEPIAS